MANELIKLPLRSTAIEARRDMAHVPEIMGVLEPVERAVFLASTDKPFSEYSPSELVAQLTTALRWISKDIGYRASDEDERQYLAIRTAEILRRYYSTLTLKDFRMAFEMSMTGELDDYLPKGRDGRADRNHYQQFNAEYVCKIIGAYIQRRGAILRKAYDAVPEESKPAPGREEVTEMMNRTKRECIRAFYYFRKNGHLPDMSPIGEMIYYKLLSDAGLAPEIAVTEDEQRAIYQRTMNRYAKRGMVGDMRRLQSEGIEATELRHGAYAMARRKALKRAFSQIAEKGIDIANYIKFE